MKCPTILAAVTLAATTPLHAQWSLHATDSSYGDSVRIDRDTAEVEKLATLSYYPGRFAGTGFYGAATHPVTGMIYLIVDDIDLRPILAFLDPSDGSFTAIGNIGEPRDPGNSASLAFGPAPDYPLYLITGGGGNASPAGAIYEVDAATGEAVALPWTTAGVGAHAIEFNPTDGFLYHFYNTSDGGGGSPGLERFDLGTGVSTPITLTGTLYGAANAVTQLGGTFYVHDKSNETLHSVTIASTTGTVASVSSLSDESYNLATVGSSLCAIYDGSGMLTEINPATGADLSSVALDQPPSNNRPDSIARDPTSGILYGMGEAPSPQTPEFPRRLFQIDPLSGKTSSDVLLDVGNLNSITFDSDGTLYGIAGFFPNQPEALPLETLATIDKITGNVVSTGIAVGPSAANLRVLAISYNPDDGLIYYLYLTNATVFMKKIDPSTGTVTSPVALSSSTLVPDTLAYDPERKLFFASASKNVFTISTTGVVTPVGETNVVSSRIYQFEFLPDLKITSFLKSGSTASIGFESVQNREYGLYSSPNLIDWDPVPGFECILASPPENIETNLPLPALDKGFFRIGKPVAK